MSCSARVLYLLFAVIFAFTGYGDVEITESGRYTGMVRANQDKSVNSVSYLVRVPANKRVEIQVAGERNVLNTNRQIVKVAFSSSPVAYLAHVFDYPDKRNASFESRNDTTVELSAECSPDGQNMPVSRYNPVTGRYDMEFVWQYHTSYYCNLSYTMDVTYYDLVPDLVVSSVSLAPSCSVMKRDETTLNFGVKNTGEKAAAKTTARIFDGATKLGEVTVEALPSGASCSKSFKLPTLSVGEHSLSVSVVAVSGEKLTSNNSKGVSLVICDATPYTVRYNANGGNGIMSDQSFVCGTGQRLKKNAFENAGFRFVGWGLAANGEIAYADEEVVKNLSWRDGGVVTLYAIWKKVEYVRVVYMPNGGSGKMESSDLTDGDRLRKCAFSREGYEFVGWSRFGYSGNNPAWAPDYPDEWRINYDTLIYYPEPENGVIRLYACWGHAVNSTVAKGVALCSGGSVDGAFWHEAQVEGVTCLKSPPVSANTVEKTWLCIYLDSPGILNFSARSFGESVSGDGFNIDARYDSHVNSPSDGMDSVYAYSWRDYTVEVSESESMFYISMNHAWREEGSIEVRSIEFDHRVSFDAQGGTAERTEVEVCRGMSLGELPSATRTGYEFLGWFTAATGGSQVTAATIVTKNVTFYAQWVTGKTSLVPGATVSIDTGYKGYTVSGLPSGLKYDKKTGKITGAAKKPTAAEGAVVTFKKSGAETEQMSIVIGPMPKLSIAMAGDTEKCKVTGAGSYLVGKKVSLKATAPKGTAFAGWFADGKPWPSAAECRTAKLSYVMTKTDVSLVAKFEKEKMSVASPKLSSASFTVGVAGSAEGIPIEIETQSGVKSVKVSKLPGGMKYDKKSGLIVGMPTNAGKFEVVIAVTAKSGAVEEITVPIEVAALPPWASGTFGGMVGRFAGSGNDDEFRPYGMITMKITPAGKITAKVTAGGKSYSFTAKGFDAKDEDGDYHFRMATRKGEVYEGEISEACHDLARLVQGGDADDPEGEFAIAGRNPYFAIVWRNEHGKDGRLAADPTGKAKKAMDAVKAFKAVELAQFDPAYGTLALKIDAKGTTKLAGKTATGVAISGSSFLMLDDSWYHVLGDMVFYDKKSGLVYHVTPCFQPVFDAAGNVAGWDWECCEHDLKVYPFE